MCGIVGAVSERNVVGILLEGIRRLEYRGYDSSGVALINNAIKKPTLELIRAVGKVGILEKKVKALNPEGHIGISHTRWATHGAPTEDNAHPHVSNNTIALVHNGIIENYEELRLGLIKEGFKFNSESDTEVIVHLIYSYLQKKNNFLEAVHKTIKKLTGSYAIAIINTSEPDKVIAVRRGSPVVVGLGIEENFVASDVMALLPVTNKFIFLDEGDIAVVERTKVNIYISKLNKLKKVNRIVKTSAISADNAERGEYRHFMQKEIFEQPKALAETLENRLLDNTILPEIFGYDAKKIFKKIKRVQIVACGSSYNAALVGKYWLEKYAKLPCNVDIASEYRSRDFIIIEEGTLFITISQSGETADTLAALRHVKKLPILASLTICNAPESSLVRESDLVFMTRAGVEVGVATTKAFTAQLAALLMLAVALSNDSKIKQELSKNLKHVPVLVEKVLALDKEISEIAKILENSHNAFFLGRGLGCPVAMEGALKLKEISYIHAESYPAGELKHGPIALIDKNMPVVVIMPNDSLCDKLKSNLQEVSARGGKLIIFADETLRFKANPDWIICKIPKLSAVAEDLVPIIYTIPLQLLSYHVAVLKGTDVDRPRNLAKSVTVE